MGFDVGGNISNVGIAQFWAESRQAVLAIGHLIGDGLFMAVVVVGEISLEIVLLERALTVHNVATPDMAEVLAGLRARHGTPLSTSIEEADSSDQIWVWNTGEDLITAVKRKANDEQKFLLSYRPSRLHPQTL